MTIFVGIDPGGTCGIALYEPDVRFEVWEMPWKAAELYFREWVFEMFSKSMSRNVVMGIERYMIGSTTHKKSSQPAAREFGVELQTMAKSVSMTVAMFPASLTKNYTNETLKALGAYTSGLGHGNDAVRVLLTAMLRHDVTHLASLLKQSTTEPPLRGLRAQD